MPFVGTDNAVFPEDAGICGLGTGQMNFDGTELRDDSLLQQIASQAFPFSCHSVD